MKTSSLFKKPIYSALVFFGTLGVLSAGYAGFITLQTSDAESGKSLTSSMMQAVIGNLADLDSRVSSMSGALSSLQAGAGGFWGAVTGGIGYSAGNVGIGTANPSYALHILNDQNKPFLSEQYNSAGNWLRLRTGLGTIASPNAITSGYSIGWLSIGGYYGGGMGEMVVGLEGIATENFTSTAQGTALLLETTLNGTTTRMERMRIDNNGNVGIGTSTPIAKLSIIGSGNLNGGSTTPSVTGAPLYIGVATDGIAIDSNQIERTISTDPLYLNYNSTAPLILNYGQGVGGNVGIGILGPASKLDVAGNISAHTDSGGQAFRAFWRSSDNFTWAPLTFTNNGSAYMGGIQWTPSGATMSLGSGLGNVMTWFPTGNATLAGTLTQSSDIRLKTGITEIENPLGKITSLSGITYYWKDSSKDSSKQIGLIAQDVEKVFPEAVYTDSDGMKSVAYGNLVAPLIEAVKAQQKKIEELETQVQELQSSR